MDKDLALGVVGKDKKVKKRDEKMAYQAYTIPIIDNRRWTVLEKQTLGVNIINLLNIQTRSYSIVQPSGSQDNAPRRYNKSKIAHLNVRSSKNRDHFIQTKVIVQQNNYDILAVQKIQPLVMPTWKSRGISYPD